MIEEYSLNNLVIDPVTVSSSGTSLVEDGTLDSMQRKTVSALEGNHPEHL